MNESSNSNHRPVTAREVVNAFDKASNLHGNAAAKPIFDLAGAVFSRGLDFSNGNPFPEIFDGFKRISEDQKARKREHWKNWKQEYKAGHKSWKHEWKAEGHTWGYGHGCGKKAYKNNSAETRTIQVD